jgi:MFS family permease
MLYVHPATTLDRAQVAAITAAIACAAVVGIGLSLSIPLLSIELARMGASSTLVGLNTAVGGLASILTVPFVPRIAARLGVVRYLMLSLVLGALTLVAFKPLDGIIAWFVLRFVLSVMLGALFVLSEFWINDVAPPARRGFVMGLYSSVLAVGFALGPSLLAVLGTRGYAPYLAGAGLFLVAIVPVWLARDLAPDIEDTGSRRFFSYVRVAPAAILASLVYGAVETGGFAILPLYGMRLGYDVKAAASLVSAMALGNALFQIPFGLLADRIGDRRRVLLIAALGGALGAALIPIAAAASFPLLFGLLFVWGGIAGTLYTVGLAHLGARLRGRDLVGANAVFIVFYDVGLTLGPAFLGRSLDLAPPQGFAHALCGVFLAYAALVLWRLRFPPAS